MGLAAGLGAGGRRVGRPRLGKVVAERRDRSDVGLGFAAGAVMGLAAGLGAGGRRIGRPLPGKVVSERVDGACLLLAAGAGAEFLAGLGAGGRCAHLPVGEGMDMFGQIDGNGYGRGSTTIIPAYIVSVSEG